MTPLPVIAAIGAAVVAATAAGLIQQGTPGPASVGAGVQPGPVRVTMAPGTTRTARVKVRDTGSAAETLAILGGQRNAGQILPFPWVHRASVTTAPGIWRTVTFTIAVPPGTAPGQYRRYVGAGASPAANPGGAGFGATSFTDLVITVAPSASPGHDTSANDRTRSQQTGA